MNYLIFCLSVCFSNTFIHVGHVAEYYYQLDGNHLKLKFVIEKEELMNFNFESDCDIENMTALCTAIYLNEHSAIKINDEKIEMELQNSYTEGDHLVLLLNGKWSGRAIKEITIENKCFYEYDRKFKNRIIMDVAQFQKSYLLNRKRDKIELR